MAKFNFNKAGTGGAVLGVLAGIPSIFGAFDKDKNIQDRALDAVQGIGGIGSLLLKSPHPVAKAVGGLGLATSMGLPIIRGAMDNQVQEVPQPIQDMVQAEPITQTRQQAVQPAPQITRVVPTTRTTPRITPIMNNRTNYQLPNIRVNTNTPLVGDEYYNRADVMNQTLGAMARGAAQNFNQVRSELTPEQLQAYTDIFNLRNQQQGLMEADVRRLQEAQEADTRANQMNRFINTILPQSTGRSGLPINLVYRDFQGNTVGSYDASGGQPTVRNQRPPEATTKATNNTVQQIALEQQARAQQLANAQEMAKLQDAIALSNATGMPIAQALQVGGKDILDYNKNVIDAQTDLLGRGVEGSYDIGQEALEQTGGLQREAYSQAAQNARTEADIQRALLQEQMGNAARMNEILQRDQDALTLAQINNEAAMNRVLQQGRNAMSLAEYKARTGTTAGYEDYMRAMISATTNPLMPEEYSMAIWNEAMRRQGINPTSGRQGNGIVDL